jgi:hypothetical protein
VVLVAIVALVVLHQLVTYVPPELKSPPPSPPSTASAPPSSGPPGEEGARQPTLEQQINEAKAAAASGQPQQITVSATEDELNAYIAERLARGASRDVRSARLSFGDGTLTLVARARVRDRWLAITAVGVPSVDADGRLRVKLESAHVGRMPLPGGMRQELETQVDRAFSEAAVQEFRLRVESVTVEPGRMELSGTTLPR